MSLPAGGFGNVLWKFSVADVGTTDWKRIPLGRDYRPVLREQIFLALMFIVLANSPVQPDLYVIYSRVQES